MDNFGLDFTLYKTISNPINRGWVFIRDWIAQILAAKYLSP